MRDFAVPWPMIETATARRRVGDWVGACAAAGVDVDLELRAVARVHGRDLASRVRDDLRHLAPDLLRWHLPRVAPDGLLRPGLTITLARYDGSCSERTQPVHLVVRTAPAWADAGQRIALTLWDGTASTLHPHPRPDRRYRLDLHPHLWDARRAHELRTRCGAERFDGGVRAHAGSGSGDDRCTERVTAGSGIDWRAEPATVESGVDLCGGLVLAERDVDRRGELATVRSGVDGLGEGTVRSGVDLCGGTVGSGVYRCGDLVAAGFESDRWAASGACDGAVDPWTELVAAGFAVDRWAAEADILLRAEERAGPFLVRLGGRRRLVLEIDGGGVRSVPDHPRAETSALPVLPDAATRVLPDLELLRSGSITADRLHPMVAEALAPGCGREDRPRRDPGNRQQTIVDCRGERHRIGLVDGVLSALDHDPAELRREELLVALTGTPLPCLRVIDAAHRRPYWLTGVRERLDHGDTAGALALVEGLLGTDAVLRDGPLREALEATVRQRITYGMFRAGLPEPGRNAPPQRRRLDNRRARPRTDPAP